MNRSLDLAILTINLLILGIPTAMLVVAWSQLVGDWRNGVLYNFAGTACLTFASASTALAIGSLVWQVFVRPYQRGDYRAEAFGCLLSVLGLISGVLVRNKHHHRYWRLGLAAAVWMVVWFALTAFSY